MDQGRRDLKVGKGDKLTYYFVCEGDKDCAYCINGFRCFSGRVYPTEWFEENHYPLLVDESQYRKPLKPVWIDKDDSRYEKFLELGMVIDMDENVSVKLESIANRLEYYLKPENVGLTTLPMYNEAVADAILLFPKVVKMLKDKGNEGLDPRFANKFIEEDHARLVKWTEKCRPDMHEPDNVGISAVMCGYILDNAFGGSDGQNNRGEMMLGLRHEDNDHIEWFNLANLIAMARRK